MKNFKEEIIYFKNKIENNDKFAFVRFGDGEKFILDNKLGMEL